ncbi:MAG: hypothetical protein MZW92_13895 [Comamonadaceae bacterium]|nr:hypothetical protein [Comamonadaceae bacterium]
MNLSALRRATALAALALAPLAPLGAAAQTYTTTHLAGGTVSELSADGRVAVGEANRTYEAFRWTAETGLVKLGRGVWIPLRHRSGTPSVSADGGTVAFTILSDDGLSSTAGRWTQATGWQPLRPLPADAGLVDGEDSSVFGLSGDGRVPVGLYWRPGQPGGGAHAMAWTCRRRHGRPGQQRQLQPRRRCQRGRLGHRRLGRAPAVRQPPRRGLGERRQDRAGGQRLAQRGRRGQRRRLHRRRPGA